MRRLVFSRSWFEREKWEEFVDREVTAVPWELSDGVGDAERVEEWAKEWVEEWVERVELSGEADRLLYLLLFGVGVGVGWLLMLLLYVFVLVSTRLLSEVEVEGVRLEILIFGNSKLELLPMKWAWGGA